MTAPNSLPELYALAWQNPNAPSPKNFAAACIVMQRAIEFAKEQTDNESRNRIIAQMFLANLDLSLKMASALSFGGGQFHIPLGDPADTAVPFTNDELSAHAEALKNQMIAAGFAVELDVSLEDRCIMFGWNLDETKIASAAQEAMMGFMQAQAIQAAADSESINKNL